MHRITLIIFLSLLTIIHCTYNPIPVGSVIISTINQIFVLQPIEYGGTDQLNVIFTATANMTIVSSIYDPSARDLYILFTNTTNGTVYICELDSLEQLDSTVYQLPFTFDITYINKSNYSFSSDVENRRGFLTHETGVVSLFSMSGLLQTTILPPANLSAPIRSVQYAGVLNRLFVITDTTVNSCINLDSNNLQCCQAINRADALRAIAFDQVNGVFYVYVLDQTSGIYQVVLNTTTNCPIVLRPINAFGSNSNLQFAIDNGLYFVSGSSLNSQDNSLIFIANGTANPRSISIGFTIVALHISPPNTEVLSSIDDSCFHGLSYSIYRAAVILAALFGTIMGIFMCLNTLFCIDFFMTKRIIRNLKQQIPHNLLEDRWNKLVEEKYAKLALEKQRKQDDPPPRRQSFITGRKTSLIPATTTTTATTTSNNDHYEASSSTKESLQIPNPLPKISDYIRRKSEGYLNRRRSDDYRTQRYQPHEELRTYPARHQFTTVQANIGPVHEERETGRELRKNLSGRELLKDEDFL